VGYANPYDEIAITSEYLWRESDTREYVLLCGIMSLARGIAQQKPDKIN